MQQSSVVRPRSAAVDTAGAGRLSGRQSASDAGSVRPRAASTQSHPRTRPGSARSVRRRFDEETAPPPGTPESSRPGGGGPGQNSSLRGPGGEIGPRPDRQGTHCRWRTSRAPPRPGPSGRRCCWCWSWWWSFDCSSSVRGVSPVPQQSRVRLVRTVDRPGHGPVDACVGRSVDPRIVGSRTPVSRPPSRSRGGALHDLSPLSLSVTSTYPVPGPPHPASARCRPG
jgi:hypothetical protein